MISLFNGMLVFRKQEPEITVNYHRITDVGRICGYLPVLLEWVAQVQIPLGLGCLYGWTPCTLPEQPTPELDSSQKVGFQSGHQAKHQASWH